MKYAIALSALTFFALYIGPKLLATVETLNTISAALN